MTVFTIRYGDNQVMVIEEANATIAEIIHKHLSDNVSSGQFTFGVAYFI
jgi:hypothetical protein